MAGDLLHPLELRGESIQHAGQHWGVETYHEAIFQVGSACGRVFDDSRIRNDAAMGAGLV